MIGYMGVCVRLASLVGADSLLDGVVIVEEDVSDGVGEGGRQIDLRESDGHRQAGEHRLEKRIRRFQLLYEISLRGEIVQYILLAESG